MGWKWKKSIKAGPMRLNLSSGGIGYSVGVKGFRVGRDAKGRSYTHTSIPGTGIYNRTYEKQIRFTQGFSSEELDCDKAPYIQKVQSYNEGSETLQTIGWFFVFATILFVIATYPIMALISGAIAFIAFIFNSSLKPSYDSPAMYYDSNQLLISYAKDLADFDELIKENSLSKIETSISQFHDEHILCLIVHRMDDVGHLMLKSEAARKKFSDKLEEFCLVMYMDEAIERINQISWRALLHSKSRMFHYAETIFPYFIQTVEDDSTRVKFLFMLAQSYFQGVEFEKAAQYFLQVVDMDSEYKDESLYLLGLCDCATEVQIERWKIVEYYNIGHEEYVQRNSQEEMKFYDDLAPKLDDLNRKKLEKLKDEISNKVIKDLEGYLGKRITSSGDITIWNGKYKLGKI